ncbi:hypothetical protein LINGRAHAP2_LOCUS3595 [Linum grandiflorum]
MSGIKGSILTTYREDVHDDGLLNLDEKKRYRYKENAEDHMEANAEDHMDIKDNPGREPSKSPKMPGRELIPAPQRY